MFAVVETCGRQYQVQEGRYIDIDLQDQEVDSNLTIDKVVAIVAGDYTQVGQPYVEGALVKAKVLKHGKDKKVVAFKMRRKKGYRLKKGHRQDFTRVLIENIDFPKKTETLKYVADLEEKEAQAAKAAEKPAKTEEKAKKAPAKTVEAKKEETVAKAETIATEAVQPKVTTEETVAQVEKEEA